MSSSLYDISWKSGKRSQEGQCFFHMMSGLSLCQTLLLLGGLPRMTWNQVEGCDISPFGSLVTAAAAKSLQSCLTLHDPVDGSPPGSPIPGKNTRVRCHFLLQCMKVKSESEVTQSCPTSSDPMDCSLPGSSIHGIFQARLLEWGAIAFSWQLRPGAPK